MTAETTHARERTLIDRHFAGRATPASEGELRAHLDGCAACRDYYQRHVILEQLDPRAVGARARLAAGLGLSLPRPARLVVPALVVAAAAAALLLLVPRSSVDPEFAARGPAVATPPAPALEVYRASGGTTAPAGGQVMAGDELAFAYRNPTGHRRLLVVGVDEAGRAYWYHPDPDASEAALAIEPGGDLRELPEAIRHQYQGRTLRVIGVFGDAALSVASVRGALASGCDSLRGRAGVGACVSVSLVVKEGP